jgi:hypothetical protein
METAEAIPLVFLAHFHESRLKETQELVERSTNPDYEYFRARNNNPALSAEMAESYRRVNALQSELDRIYLQMTVQWTRTQIDDCVRMVDLSLNQAVISRWVRAYRAVNDLNTQKLYIRTQNDFLRARIEREKAIKR